jgi:Peptidase family M48
MRAVGPRVRRSIVALAVAAFAVGAGCAEKLASAPRPLLEGCGGLFTSVALPRVTSDEQRALEESVPHLTERELNLRLRGNYYRIVYDEGGSSTSESREAFVTRMLSEEHAPPGLLAGVVLKSLRFAAVPTPEQRRALRRAVAEARRPLARRLNRVAATLAAAAGQPDVTCRLDARLRLNAGAEVGFTSRRILVGPSLVLLAESEDALAFVIGHELAHVVHHHTRFRAVQDLFVRTLTLGYGTGVAGDAIVGVLSQGSLPAFNRDQECEADYYALGYMRKAGYRPEAAAEFWKAVLALRPTTSREKVPFLSERPPEAERVLRLARWTQVHIFRDSSADPSWDLRRFEDIGPGTVQDLSSEDAIESFGVVLE